MVKRIKKRISKNKNEESVQGDSEVEVSEGVISAESDGSPVESPAALRDEIAANAQGASADRFSEVMEGLLLNLADNWLIVLLLMGSVLAYMALFNIVTKPLKRDSLIIESRL